jgi:diguanylate cyclase (GGDEF)-like protein/PAS domain S-box-containing protein
MGAFAIDVPVAPFLSSARTDASIAGGTLFLALSAFGLAISLIHFRQIGEREIAAAELSRTQNFLHTIIENMPMMLTVKELPEHRYVLINRAAQDVFGIPRREMIGKRVQDIFPDGMSDPLSVDGDEVGGGDLAVVNQHTITTPQGGPRLLTTKKLIIRRKDGQPHYLLNLSEDITERKQAEERVEHMSRHDALTGLPNRVAFADYLQETMGRAGAEGTSFAVMSLDLDRFKEVNDVFGHTFGDDLLREVSSRMREVANGTFIARLGGDEFSVVASEGPQPLTAESLAADLQRVIEEVVELDDHRIRIGVSIGVAIYPTDGTDAATLLGNSDAALYRAKGSGRGAIRFFEAEMDLRLRERRSLQQDLQCAIERNELSLCYQPQARIGGEIIGFEALLRWTHPTRGAISPAEFIPLAEQSGSIFEISEWVLRTACREAASWPRPLQIAINLSPVQFRHGDLPGLVHSALLESGLAPKRLELEITEGVLVDDFSRAVSILRRLKSLGVRIAMDDFGTGYSSLSYLQSFPFDKIKIDQAFISNLQRSQQSAAIIRAVIGLGRGLELPVAAEGVETKDQLAFLSREACDEIQGFLIGKPCPIEEYAEVVGRPPTRRERASLSVG